MMLRRFLYAQCKESVSIALSLFIFVTVALMLIFHYDNLLLVSFYIAIMYIFALLSDELIAYRHTLAAAPIAQRTFLYNAFFMFVAVGIGLIALYSILAAIFSIPHMLAYFVLLLLFQLSLVLFLPNLPYVVIAFIVVYVLSIIDIENFTLSLQFVFILYVPFILSFFLLNRSTKWRASS
ncbi:MAG: hypothetical protein UHX00_07295 [Caryophanon sp.]|nr:hypothetical protein [Caryophanon sp.]